GVAPASRALRAKGARLAIFPRYRRAWFQPLADRLIILPARSRFRRLAFHRCKSKFSCLLQFVTAYESVNYDGRANQRQRNESEPNFGPATYCVEMAPIWAPI